MTVLTRRAAIDWRFVENLPWSSAPQKHHAHSRQLPSTSSVLVRPFFFRFGRADLICVATNILNLHTPASRGDMKGSQEPPAGIPRGSFQPVCVSQSYFSYCAM
ncbi:hypothetical protein Naga_100723g3 [Nannochloropsis gaditana]|uniref:Uncharacterized protein n=1 Tax=Nannochloropsis gaditana TaxID=72520 RepID=W7TMQ0_9STRA|nr:hypothetical protein Naga_100723g3 [Nannochloropsis gaditana]